MWKFHSGVWNTYELQTPTDAEKSLVSVWYKCLLLRRLDCPAGATSRCYNEDRSPVPPLIRPSPAITSTANGRSAIAAPDQSEGGA